jgi:aminoglycoside phosphotransferase (APT) family kinase protein
MIECPESVSLSGFSGASVALARRDGALFVRKIAANADASDRLRRQAAKQRAYAAINAPLATPPIVAEGEVEGRYFFEMPYIVGCDGHTFLSRCTFDELKGVLNQLWDHLRRTASLDAISASPHPSFFSAAVHKLLAVQCRTKAIGNELLGRLFLQLDRLRACEGQKEGLCHGDLTFENLLIDRVNRVWLVDFLDSPFEHPWQDYVKLRQDLEGEWYLRKGIRISPAVVWYARRQHDDLIQAMSPEFGRVANALSAITFVRILPYAHSAEDRSFILARIAHFVQQSEAQP